jgi:ATP/maltotriose-dependent transcriptional regulator MalT
MNAPTHQQPLQSARAAIARRDWQAAYDAFREARSQTDLPVDDLFNFGDAAWWIGQIDDAIAAFELAYRGFVAGRRWREASLCATYTGFTRGMRGEHAAASAWIQRAYRHLEQEPDCVERAYLVYLEFDTAIGQADIEAAREAWNRLHDFAARFDDVSLRAISVLAEGKLLVYQGEVEAGFALLDEAMLAAITDDLDPSWAGNIYCTMMILCEEVLDIRRAVEWTRATLRWCEGQSSTGPFMGICQAHRSSVLRIQGQWQQAEAAIHRVLADPLAFDLGSVAEARYQLAELHRLRGNLDDAGREYAEALLLGRDPQPGCSLLLMGRGDPAGASKSIAAALEATRPGSVPRARLLPAAVEIGVAAREIAFAESASRELGELAGQFRTAGFAALARQAEGTVLLAKGEWHPASGAFREACRQWTGVSSTVESATCRALLGLALRGMGDTVSAERELAAAESVFAQLGMPLPQLVQRLSPSSGALPGGLSEREAEVLALVAAGLTNREIGDALFISPKTVSRHLENIYAKLSLSSRAAAAAWAIEQGIARKPSGVFAP